MTSLCEETEVAMNASEQMIRRIVEEVLSRELPQKPEFEKHRDKSGVLSVRTETVKTEPFCGRTDVRLKDISTLEEAPRIGAGIMELDKTSFKWTLDYDEYDYIIDGTLEIVIGDSVITGNKGDILYIPKGSSILFRSPGYVRFAYFVYPADWAK